MEITAFGLAQRFVGVREVKGAVDNPLVCAMLRLDDDWPEHDEVPWCSAFVNFVCWLLRLPRSKSLAARSWLGVGTPVPLSQAVVGFDVVVLQRGDNPKTGHVGFFAGFEGPLDVPRVLVLGGNQGDAVALSAFDQTRVLGVRRLL